MAVAAQVLERLQIVAESCLNGSSEMVSQLVAVLTTYLFNTTIAEAGGRRRGCCHYHYHLFSISVEYFVLGYFIEIAPVIGFHYGSGNHKWKRKVLGISMKFPITASLMMFAFSLVGGPHIAGMFADIWPAGQWHSAASAVVGTHRSLAGSSISGRDYVCGFAGGAW